MRSISSVCLLDLCIFVNSYPCGMLSVIIGFISQLCAIIFIIMFSIDLLSFSHCHYLVFYVYPVIANSLSA